MIVMERLTKALRQCTIPVSSVLARAQHKDGCIAMQMALMLSAA
jgi:hypothetical protein